MSELWTVEQGRTDDLVPRAVPRDRDDWGMTCLYRFHDPRDLAPFLALTVAVAGALAALDAPVRIPPYYAIGADALTQVKPPYDGGYSTGRFGEFLATGDCKPGPGFVVAHAQLLDLLIERHHDLARPLRRIVHHSLIRPWSHLFWDDAREPAWTLYWPCIERDDLEPARA